MTRTAIAVVFLVCLAVGAAVTTGLFALSGRQDIHHIAAKIDKAREADDHE